MSNDSKTGKLPTICEFGIKIASHVSPSLAGVVEGSCRKATGTSEQITSHKSETCVTTTKTDWLGRKTTTTSCTSQQVTEEK